MPVVLDPTPNIVVDAPGVYELEQLNADGHPMAGDVENPRQSSFATPLAVLEAETSRLRHWAEVGGPRPACAQLARALVGGKLTVEWLSLTHPQHEDLLSPQLAQALRLAVGAQPPRLGVLKDTDGQIWGLVDSEGMIAGRFDHTNGENPTNVPGYQQLLGAIDHQLVDALLLRTAAELNIPAHGAGAEPRWVRLYLKAAILDPNLDWVAVLQNAGIDPLFDTRAAGPFHVTYAADGQQQETSFYLPTIAPHFVERLAAALGQQAGEPTTRFVPFGDPGQNAAGRVARRGRPLGGGCVVGRLAALAGAQIPNVESLSALLDANHWNEVSRPLGQVGGEARLVDLNDLARVRYAYLNEQLAPARTKPPGVRRLTLRELEAWAGQDEMRRFAVMNGVVYFDDCADIDDLSLVGQVLWRLYIGEPDPRELPSGRLFVHQGGDGIYLNPGMGAAFRLFDGDTARLTGDAIASLRARLEDRDVASAWRSRLAHATLFLRAYPGGDEAGGELARILGLAARAFIHRLLHNAPVGLQALTTFGQLAGEVAGAPRPEVPQFGIDAPWLALSPWSA